MAPAKIKRRGLMLVLSSPSGAGKTTISRKLLEQDERISLSVSATTRPRRPGEVNGQDYFFVAADDFEEMVARQEFLEHARVFDHRYGTPRGAVEQALSVGRDVLFDIDWQGTQQLAEKVPKDLVRIFILPPSTEELRVRLTNRAQDPPDVVEGRMSKAADEMSHWAEYDYIVINEDVAESVKAVEAILTAERLKRERRVGLRDFVELLRQQS